MKQRLYNIYLCRIISMLGILTLHYNLSGVLNAVEKGGAAYWVAWILEIVALCSVNVFAMMSGYLGWEKTDPKTRRLVDLLFTVLFECIVITAVFLVLKPAVFTNWKDILFALLPPMNGRLWYITCFVPLFLFQPLINRVLLGLTEKQERNVCIISTVLLGCIPSLIKVDLFHVNNGYSFLWLVVCYSLGHYVRRVEQKINLKHGFNIFMGGITTIRSKSGDILCIA